MTSNNAPAPYVASSSPVSTIFGTTNSAYKAFDNNPNTVFETDGIKTPTNPYLKIDFGSSITVLGISMTAATNSNNWNLRLPKAFTIEASNNDDEYVTVYQANGTEYPAPNGEDVHIYTFSPVRYRYYKITSHNDYYENSGGCYFITSNILFALPNPK